MQDGVQPSGDQTLSPGDFQKVNGREEIRPRIEGVLSLCETRFRIRVPVPLLLRLSNSRGSGNSSTLT
jgi:hypothetical protein